VQTAHIAGGLEELLTLWEEWKAKDNGTRPVIEEKLDQRIAQLKRETQDNSARLDAIADALEDRVRTLRLLPLANVFRLFPRMVRDLAKQEKKQVNLLIEGAETAADKRILEEIKDPLIHLIRNAIDHGIESPAERDRAGKPPTATLTLRGYQTTSNVIIEVSDDGRGLHLERIRRTAVRRGLYTEAELDELTPGQIQNLIFTPGFSTQNLITEVSGRGVGLDVVKTNVERLKGPIQVESTPGQGTTFRLQLGTTLATSNVLLIEVMGIPHALPIEYVETSLLVEPEDIFPLDGTDAIAIDGQPVSVAHLHQLLGFSEMNAIAPSAKAGRAFPCVLLRVGEERFGIFVDQLLDTQDVVLKSQSKLLRKVRTVAGTTILGTGDVCMILHPPDLLELVQQGLVQTPTQIVTSQITRRPLVLLAEDSITIRTQEKRILESAGYDVVTAVDGMDGLNKLKTHTFDAVISDVQMPNMTGLDLTQYIRQNPEYNELPVILVTSLASEDDRRRGAEAGADAYITKGSFNQEVLLDTLQRLI
jgi:two-component system chemotaxis sensor kinase CheA